MTKTSSLSALALVAVIAGAAVATPVLAADHSKLFDSDYYITQLRYDGVNAIAADQVTHDVFRATVKLPSGQEVFQFFDADSLQLIKR
jgi:hypothetical protein